MVRAEIVTRKGTMPFSRNRKTIGMLKTVPSNAPQMPMAARSFILRIPWIRAI